MLQSLFFVYISYIYVYILVPVQLKHFFSDLVQPPMSISRLHHAALCLSLKIILHNFLIYSCPISPFLFFSLQEKRISSLDAANSRLMSALTQVKERYSMQNMRNGLSPTNPTKLSITENGEFKNSSC